MRHTNPSGYVYYDNEAELCKELEKLYLPDFFDTGWKPVEFITKEVWLSSKKRIDYFGYKGDRPTYIEVKNWFLKHKDIKQIKNYSELIEKKHPGWGKIYVICGGVYKEQYNKLLAMDGFANIILTKDIKELNPMELVHWM